MTVFLLDTNIVSLFDPRRREQNGALLAWLHDHDAALYLSAITVLEIESGRLKLLREAKEARARDIEALRIELMAGFATRILPVDASAALAAAQIADAAKPHVIEAKDLLIAATARTHGLTVLTRNLRHFLPTGVPCHDPTERLP